MSASKRASSPSSALIKRARMDEDDPRLTSMVVASDGNSANKGALIQTVKRTSGLQAPIMCLKGHQAEVLDLKFSPDGETLASAGADKVVLLWRVYGDCENYGFLRTGKGTPTSLCFPSSSTLLVSSSDATLFLFALKSGEVLRRFRGHKSVVNCVDVQKGGAGTGLIASGSDDGTVRVWREDEKEAVEVVEMGYPVTAIKWSPDSQTLFIGGIDNDIHSYSLSTRSITYTLRSHTDTITSLSLHPTSPFLLSASQDSLLHLWSVQPFAPTVNAQNPTAHPRWVRTFYGAPAGFEGLLRRASWSRHEQKDGGRMVAIGGADRALTIWDATTGEILYKLPGHTGTVVASDWSPKEPIVASGGVEGVIYLGEVQER